MIDHCSARGPSPADVEPQALLVPVAGLALGAIFFVYSRTSIQAAKENARKHREADGGTISWRNESMRRHGALEKPRERTLWQQFSSGSEDAASREARERESSRLDALARAKGEKNLIEEGIRRAKQGLPTRPAPGEDD